MVEVIVWISLVKSSKVEVISEVVLKLSLKSFFGDDFNFPEKDFN